MIKPFDLFLEKRQETEFLSPTIDKILELFATDIVPEQLHDYRLELEEILGDLELELRDITESGLGKTFNLNPLILKLEAELNPVINRELNLSEFLRMVNNLLRVPKRKTSLKLEAIFEAYFDTLTPRFNLLADVIRGHRMSEYEDRFEEEDKSVLQRDEYESELYELQIQLNRLQKWVAQSGRRVAIVFEGRDAAGKGGAIKRFVQYLPVKGHKVVTMGIPKPEEMEGDAWFQRYEKKMPKAGEIVFFDRSWYGMALVNPTMGYCTEEQYRYFMEHVNQFEDKLAEQGIDLIKLWFSISQEKQLQRFKLRQSSELKYWKFSESDLKSVDKWERFTNYKEQCFQRTSTGEHPWVIVNSNDKKLARLNAIRYVLSQFNYKDKDATLTKYYPEIIYELR